MFFSPFLTAWTWGGADPESRKERLSGLSGIFTILEVERQVRAASCVAFTVRVCLIDCAHCLTLWLWWRPAAAESAACKRPGQSWRRPPGAAWGTAGPRWWCRSFCPPAGRPSGRTDGQAGDRMSLFIGCSFFKHTWFTNCQSCIKVTPQTLRSVWYRWNITQAFPWQV